MARDALVVTGDTSGLVLDLAFDIAEVGEAAVGDMVELGPFTGSRGGVVPLGGVVGGGGFSVLVRDVDELEDQRSTSDNATASRQKISTDNVLEDGGLASRLGAYDDLDENPKRKKVVSIESRRAEGVY